MPQPWKPPLQSPRLWGPGIPLLLEHFHLLGQEAEVLQPSAALELDSWPSPKLHVEPLWKENSQEMETGQDPRLGDLKPRTLTWAQPGPGPVSHGVGV